jgi:hypothetical protein
MHFHERHLRADGRMVEAAVDEAGGFALRFGRPGEWLVSYAGGRRVVNGRSQPYVFRSVEQLRYDFERDVEDAERHARDGRQD